MQIKHWKFVAAGLVLVILILCMMTFFLNSSNRNLLIQLNRMDREKGEMQRDYEKLYNAYYSYDKKVLKLLEGRNDVYWAEDSSAYVVNHSFSFFKKPRMEKPYFIWWYYPKKMYMHNNDTTQFYNFQRYWRVDTLKPHQSMYGPYEFFYSIMVAPASSSDSLMPDSSRTVSFLLFNTSEK